MPPFVPTDSVPVPLRHVEEELNRQLRSLQGTDGTPIQRACMSNLVIFCDRREQAETTARLVPEIVAAHPARVLLVVGEADGEPDPAGVSASVLVRHLQGGKNLRSFSEQVTLHAMGAAVAKLPFAVRALVIGDLPINLWWNTLQ